MTEEGHGRMGETRTCEEYVLGLLKQCEEERELLRWKVGDLERKLDELRDLVSDDDAPHTWPDAAPCRFCGHEPLVEASRTGASAKVWCANITCMENPSVRGRGRIEATEAWNLLMGGDDDA